MGEVSANAKDAQTSAIIPIDGVSVPSAGAAPTTGQALRQAITIAKSDGSTEYADPDGSGNLQVNIKAVGAGTIPVSATSLPLPDGAATAASQPELDGDGGALAHVTNFPATQPVSGTVAVSNLPSTQPVSAASLPLPTGAAQDGTDGTGISPPAGGGGIRGWLSGIYHELATTLAVAVSNFPSVQAVTGTFWQATQPVSAASLPLPTGAAQDGTDATGSAPPTGATGIRGWLSGIYTSLIGTLSVSLSGSEIKTSAPAVTDPALIVRGLQNLEDLCVALKKVLEFTETPLFIETATGRIRVTLDAVAGALTFSTITTVGTVTTVSTVTNMSQLGGFDAKQTLLYAQDDQVFGALIRPRIT